MEFFVTILSSLLCLFVYVRMYKKDQPQPIGFLKAALPVGLGAFAPFLSTTLFLLIGLAVAKFAGTTVSQSISSAPLKSFVSAFLTAGFPEEFVKFILLLIVLWIAKPKNVYEYAFLGAGIGFGFTVLEDYLYGDGNLSAALIRIPTFASHMVFGMIMGLNLGIARHKKLFGGSAFMNRLLAFCLPLLWHTVYDAFTVANFALFTEDSSLQDTGLLVGMGIMVLSIVLHIVLLVRFRKKAPIYCAMETVRK